MLQTLSLNNSSAVVTAFALKSVKDSSVAYMAPSSSIAAPLTLTVDVQSKDITSTASDRITVRAQLVKKDAVTGQPVAVNVSTQIVLPRNTIFTDAERKDMLSFVQNYLAMAGAWDSLCDGIIP